MGIRFGKETANAIYFALCENGYNVSAAMRAVGGSAGSFWHWAGESVRQKNEIEHDPDATEIVSKFYIAGFNPERPEEKMWWHEAVGHRAKRIAALQADSRARASLAPTPLRDQKGDIVWEKCPMLLATYGGETQKAYEAADAMGEVDYPYLHRINARGLRERIPVMVDQIAATKFQHITRSTMGHLGYNPSDVKQVTTRHKIEGVVAFSKPPEAPQQQQQIAKAPRPHHPLDDVLARMRAAGGPANPKPRAPVNLGLPAPSAHDPPDGVTGAQPEQAPPERRNRVDPHVPDYNRGMKVV